MEIETKLSKASMHKTMLCPYRHDGVWCDEFSVCWTCGWHPKIEEERKRILREKYPEEILEVPIVTR